MLVNFLVYWILPSRIYCSTAVKPVSRRYGVMPVRVLAQR